MNSSRSEMTASSPGLAPIATIAIASRLLSPSQIRAIMDRLRLEAFFVVGDKIIGFIAVKVEILI